ncbi:MAG: hypothetical protein QM786_00585 [Breznakibacter sp.]
MEKKYRLLLATVLVVLCFGLTHSLKGAWEITNLVVMGLSLLYLLFEAYRSIKNKQDS